MPSRVIVDCHAVAMVGIAPSLIALQYASEDIKKNRDVALAAVMQDGTAYLYVDPSLRADPEIAYHAVKGKWQLLALVPDEARADAKIVLQAVAQSGRAVRFASPMLLAREPAILGKAVEKCGEDLLYGPRRKAEQAEARRPRLPRSRRHRQW